MKGEKVLEGDKPPGCLLCHASPRAIVPRTADALVQATFRLVNMRAPYVFYLFRGGLRSPSLVTVSTTSVAFANPAAPLHPRLSFVSSPGGMQVTWSVARGSGGGVMWWVSGGEAAPFEAEGEERGYAREDMCGGRATSEGYR